jgi:Zn-dependent protease with chaperone function
LNFFEHQDAARRASRRMVWLFAASVLAIVVAIDLVLALVAGIAGVRVTGGFHAAVTALVLLVIFGGTWWQIRQLAGGGEAVAALLGARAVDPSTGDLLERRLANIVEEMALASGIAVPRCYLLEHQRFINACAAGHTLDNAAVIVTRGALTRLSRDELQGVIAHEFAHIVNGDMRLNLRLVGVTFGLLVVALAGQKLIEHGPDSSDARASIGLLLVGGVLIALGWLGVLCGRAIKAGVSRDREYLADASAVQFTRNPDSIGGALRKIGGLGGAGGIGPKVRADAGEVAAAVPTSTCAAPPPKLSATCSSRRPRRRSKAVSLPPIRRWPNACGAFTGARWTGCRRPSSRWRVRWSLRRRASCRRWSIRPLRVQARWRAWWPQRRQ